MAYPGSFGAPFGAPAVAVPPIVVVNTAPAKERGFLPVQPVGTGAVGHVEPTVFLDGLGGRHIGVRMPRSTEIYATAQSNYYPSGWKAVRTDLAPTVPVMAAAAAAPPKPSDEVSLMLDPGITATFCPSEGDCVKIADAYNPEGTNVDRTDGRSNTLFELSEGYYQVLPSAGAKPTKENYYGVTYIPKEEYFCGPIICRKGCMPRINSDVISAPVAIERMRTLDELRAHDPAITPVKLFEGLPSYDATAIVPAHDATAIVPARDATAIVPAHDEHVVCFDGRNLTLAGFASELLARQESLITRQDALASRQDTFSQDLTDIRGRFDSFESSMHSIAENSRRQAIKTDRMDRTLAAIAHRMRISDDGLSTSSSASRASRASRASLHLPHPSHSHASHYPPSHGHISSPLVTPTPPVRRMPAGIARAPLGGTLAPVPLVHGGIARAPLAHAVRGSSPVGSVAGSVRSRLSARSDDTNYSIDAIAAGTRRGAVRIHGAGARVAHT
jgi:hypothetical protein